MELPIDVVPGTCPVQFRWKHVVDVPVDAGAPDDRRVVEVRQPIPAALERPVAELIARCKALQKFKDWVHAYLDARGVPHRPPGEHGEVGCRIGDRMDYVWAELEGLRRSVSDGTSEKANTIGGTQDTPPRPVTDAEPKPGRRSK